MLEYHGFSGEADELLQGYHDHLKRGAIEFTMIESIFNIDNSTDIAFTLAYRGRIGTTSP
ncbi:DUF3187 family protein [Ferrimonas balearica]|uniref:DUF3187 family protein n=1 Tax=Ferrimonas balearica TaxID=44012 RepID=UPI001C962153|nr:DUF3187 family protein [Ferrimonas balearica]